MARDTFAVLPGLWVDAAGLILACLCLSLLLFPLVRPSRRILSPTPVKENTNSTGTLKVCGWLVVLCQEQDTSLYSNMHATIVPSSRIFRIHLYPVMVLGTLNFH